MLEVALPEDIERLRHSRKRDLGLSERLELSDESVCGVNSIELNWRPPTKNAERIEKYKLMIATVGVTCCNILRSWISLLVIMGAGVMVSGPSGDVGVDEGGLCLPG